jgi:hypothetical protein
VANSCTDRIPSEAVPIFESNSVMAICRTYCTFTRDSSPM